MTKTDARKPLRLWPGVVIVVLSFISFYVPSYLAPASGAMFWGMMGSLFGGTLLLFAWWLFFSRARWFDRLGGLALLIVSHTIALVLAHPSAKMVTMFPGVLWLSAVFVASLFVGMRTVTVVAVLIASLGWTLVRTEGVTGTLSSDYAWRFSATTEERFMASEASAMPAGPAISPTADAAPTDPAVTGSTEDPIVGETFETSAWPGFRGPDRDNVLDGVTVGSDWSQSPPKEIWRRPVGPGWGSFALVGNRLCTQEQRDEKEVVVCYDSETGEPIWLHAYPARFWEAMGGQGPRATPTYHEGRLYTLGATGVLNCLDAETGEPVWTRDIAEDTGARVPDWGFASSPLIVDDRVIVHASGAPEGRAVAAYDLASGEPSWFGDAAGHSYSSPQLATIDGVRQIVMLTGDGAFGLDPTTGASLWKHDWLMGANGSRVVQPAIVEGDGILIGTSFGMGTRKIAVSNVSGSWTVDEQWTSRGLKPYYNDLVVHRGFAFGFDANILAAIDVATGDRAWKGGRYGNGQMLLLPDQDLLLVISEKGELALVRATAERFEEVARMQVLEGKTWNHPIVVDGVVYLRNSEEAAAYRLPT
jgi:outer membrane protein assembly factor BamB